LPDESKQDNTPVSHRGPVEYDLVGMPDPDFDRLCYRLIRLEHPNAIKPTESGDGGADALLPAPGAGYERAWQAKHYPKAIRWTECRKSFEDAIANYEPAAYTFCFPRDLSGREQQTFDKHFRNGRVEIPVDFWNGSEIQARLTESDAGKRVAAHFFKDDADQLKAIERAALAKGELSTVGDALERMNPIGGFLAGSDPYFSYPAAIYEAGEAAKTPVAEGAVMSVEQPSGALIARIDVVPRDEEALELFRPKGTITFPVETYERLQEAVRRGEATSAEGLEVTFEQLPPALSEDIGKPMVGTVSFEPDRSRAPKPWDARFVGRLGDLSETVDAKLEPAAPPSGWDGCLEGGFAGLSVRFLFRRRGEGGQMAVNYSYRLGEASARDQLKVLRFLDIVSEPGSTMQVVDKKDRERELLFDGGALDDDADTSALMAFFECIVEIESWTGERIPVKPADFTDENFRQATSIAAAIRRKGFKARFEQVELALPEENLGVVESGRELVIEQGFGGKVFGKEVDLGQARVQVDEYRVEHLGKDEEGHYRVRLRPVDEESAEVFQHIAPPRRTRRPPPPPRKKKSRGRSKRRGGRSR
jgi:hypothetical protein